MRDNNTWRNVTEIQRGCQPAGTNGWTNGNSWSMEMRNNQVLKYVAADGVSAGMGCTVQLGQPGSKPDWYRG